MILYLQNVANEVVDDYVGVVAAPPSAPTLQNRPRSLLSGRVVEESVETSQ